MLKVQVLGFGLALGCLLSTGCADEGTGIGQPTTTPNEVTEEPPPAEAPKQLRTMPLPEGKWAKATNAAHYKIFATHDDALEWFDAFHAKIVTPITGKTVKALPRTDTRYAALETELATMWPAFVELLPRDTEGLAKAPFIVLTDDREVNAFAVYDPDLELLPHAFMINVGVLTTTNGKASSAQLRGLIAHELGHHVLKHGWPDNHPKVERWYSTDKVVGDGFGWQQKDDAKLRAKGYVVIGAELQAGRNAMTEWNGVPRFGGWLFDTLAIIHEDAAKKGPDACLSASIARNELDAYANGAIDEMGTLKAGSRGARTRINELTMAYVEKERVCGKAETQTLWTVMAKQFNVSEAELRKGTDARYTAIIDGADSAAAAVFSLVKMLDGDVVGLGSSTVSKLRYYSTEEEADDVSINVLFRSGMDANGTALFLHDIFLDPRAEKACAAQLNAGGEPDYGPLSDSHHGTCWRVWHSRQLVKYLSTPE